MKHKIRMTIKVRVGVSVRLRGMVEKRYRFAHQQLINKRRYS